MSKVMELSSPDWNPDSLTLDLELLKTLLYSIASFIQVLPKCIEPQISHTIIKNIRTC